jgi:hypothetical protein
MRYIRPVDDVSDFDYREEFPAPLFDARIGYSGHLQHDPLKLRTIGLLCLTHDIESFVPSQDCVHRKYTSRCKR